jgi:hypothetical protein
MHKTFSVFVNVINNLMRIHCLLMIGSLFGNDFPLILIFILISNVLRLRGLNLLYYRGDGQWISERKAMEDGHNTGHALFLKALLS